MAIYFVALSDVWEPITVFTVKSKSQNTSPQDCSFSIKMHDIFLLIIACLHEYYNIILKRDQFHCAMTDFVSLNKMNPREHVPNFRHVIFRQPLLVGYNTLYAILVLAVLKYWISSSHISLVFLSSKVIALVAVFVLILMSKVLMYSHEFWPECYISWHKNSCTI